MNTTPTTHQRIATVENELRDIYRNTNEGPMLLALMVERLRDSRYPVVPSSAEQDLRDEVERQDRVIERLRDRVEALENPDADKDADD